MVIPEALVRLVAEPIFVVQSRFFCVLWELFCWKVPSVRSKVMLILVDRSWFNLQLQDRELLVLEDLRGL